jgi:hypothetical protein
MLSRTGSRPEMENLAARWQLHRRPAVAVRDNRPILVRRKNGPDLLPQWWRKQRLDLP